jgi:hypothetical protein
MYTEDEAREKWCPEARTLNINMEVNYNRFCSGEIEKETLCIASACMMWRWGNAVGIDNEGNEHKIAGYCGKSGKP